ncbi:M24 family metallopeptidase (plasmid) [Pseudomonas silvicola]|nr:M24 family metallopeptidase [Pseudomonas silvicola]
MRPFVWGDLRSAELALHYHAIQDEQFRAMKPGVSAREVDAIVREGLLRNGLRTDYPNITGYALGLYTRTPRPVIFL